jgi:mannose-1-phosphate guanylyltransferase
VPVANRPTLEHILLLLVDHGVDEAVVNLHHYPEAITAYFGDGSRWDLSLHYALEEELLGTAGGVKNNQGFLEGDTFLVVSGDALTDIDLSALLAAHRRHGSLATLAVMEVEDPSEYGVMVVDQELRVTGFQEKPSPAEALSRLSNCGIYVFEPAIFERIPAGAFYDFGRQVLPGLLEDGIPFHVHPVSSYWNDVGSLAEYRRGNFDAIAGRVQVQVPGRRIGERFWSGEATELVGDAEVIPPVLLGAGCRVGAGASLRGPVIVGDGCTIGAGAVVESTILWDAVKVGAGSRVVDAIVASSVELGEGVKARGAVVGQGCVVGSGVDLADGSLDPGSTLA